jgi:hypothetical protein
MAAAVPIAVFLCLRAAGDDVGLALGGGPSMPSSDTQVVASFSAPTTSADDTFDRRAGTRASVAFGGFARDQGSTKSGGGKGSSGGKAGSSGGGGGGGNKGGNGGTDPTPPPPPGLLQPLKDALKPITEATGTGPVVDDVTGTVEGTLDDVTGSLPPLPEIPSLP